MSRRLVLALLALLVALPAVAVERDTARVLGARAAAQFQGGVRLVPTHAPDSVAVRATARRLLERMGEAVRDLRMTESSFRVYESPRPEAFSFPDGTVFLSTGLLKAVSRRREDPGGLLADEVAFVLAHELAHLAGRHHSRRLEEAGALQSLLPAGAEVVLEALTEPLQQELEVEADRQALLYAVQAGYQGERIVAFVRRLPSLGGAGMNRTHPPLARRADLLQEFYGGELLRALGNWRRGLRDHASGRYGDAVMWFRRVEEVLPLVPAVWYNEGAVLLEWAAARRAGQLLLLPVPAPELQAKGPPTDSEARLAFERALQCSAHFTRAWEGLALCLWQSGREREALDALEHVPGGGVRDPLILTARAGLRHREFLRGGAGAEQAGKDADRLYRQALHASGGAYWPARFNLAMLLQLRDPPAAREQWRVLARAPVGPHWQAVARRFLGSRPKSARGTGPAVLSADGRQVPLDGAAALADLGPPDSEEDGWWIYEGRGEFEIRHGRVARAVLPGGSPWSLDGFRSGQGVDRVTHLGPPSRRVPGCGLGDWLVYDGPGLGLLVQDGRVVEVMRFSPGSP